MSMFYELMMRKKEEIMYATIKGSLTENDGVFSGFSTSNYLTLQQTFGNINSFEIVLRVKVSTSGANGFFGASNGQDKQGIALQIGTDNKLKYFLSSNGTSWNIGTGTGTTVFALDTFYYIKVKFTGTQYIISSSTDRINWVIEKTITSSLMIYIPNEPYNIGYNIYTGGSQQYFRGSIDLPNSYIKLGGTKYNLQAVVGYTIVGSPTITDGVASGFSSANYLEIAQNFDMRNKNFVFITKIKTGANVAGQYVIFSNSNQFFLSLFNNSKFILYYPNENGSRVYSFSNIVAEINTEYDIRIEYRNNYILFYINNVLQFSFLSNFSNFVLAVINFGLRTSSTLQNFNGSIDMNNTYIQINNKLWFNGQQS